MAALSSTNNDEENENSDENSIHYCDVCSLRLGRDTCGPLTICIRCLRSCCGHCHRLYMALTDITEHEYCNICRERDLEGRDLILNDTTQFHKFIYLCPYCDSYFLSERGPGLCDVCEQYLYSTRKKLGIHPENPLPDYAGKTLVILNHPNNHPNESIRK